jgi:hypothetical protein
MSSGEADYVKANAPERDVWADAVTDLVAAKLAEATAFVRLKAAKSDRTDGTAARMAYIETNGSVDLAQARVDYLRAHLGRV